MKEIINIESREDIEKLLFAIIQNKEVTIGDVKPIPFAFRFKGERFQLKDGYISADFADLLVSFKKDYRDFLAKTVGKNKAKEVEILFKIENGSIKLDFLNDIPSEAWELVGKMDGTQLTVTVVIAILAYFSHKSWKDFLDNKKEIMIAQLSATNNTQALKIATDAIDLLKENKKLEVSKNRPIKNALAILKENEELEISNSTTTPITYKKEDIDKFEYDEEEDDTTHTYKETFIIKGFTKEHYGWNIKIEFTDGSHKPKTFWANSKLLPADNIKLFQNADNGTNRKLEVVVVKNKDKVKEAYISNILA